MVLWAYWTTSRIAMGETPFSLAFSIEAIVLVEVKVPTFRIKAYDETKNGEDLTMSLDLLKERRNEAWTHIQKNK